MAGQSCGADGVEKDTGGTLKGDVLKGSKCEGKSEVDKGGRRSRCVGRRDLRGVGFGKTLVSQRGCLYSVSSLVKLCQ